jgi:hypothetical protein
LCWSIYFLMSLRGVFWGILRLINIQKDGESLPHYYPSLVLQNLVRENGTWAAVSWRLRAQKQPPHPPEENAPRVEGSLSDSSNAPYARLPFIKSIKNNNALHIIHNTLRRRMEIRECILYNWKFALWKISVIYGGKKSWRKNLRGGRVETLVIFSSLLNFSSYGSRCAVINLKIKKILSRGLILASKEIILFL